MFEDLAGSTPESGFHSGLSDREILYGIYHAIETGDLPSADGWKLLHERYPNELPIRLAYAFEGLHEIAFDADSFLAFIKPLAKCPLPLKAPMRALMVLAHDQFPDRIPAKSSQDLDKAFAARNVFMDYTLRDLHNRTDEGLSIADSLAADIEAEEAAIEAALPKGPAVPYNAQASFQVGDFISHPKFGQGIVKRRVGTKINVAFPDQERVLICK
jgi:hypothetical protein